MIVYRVVLQPVAWFPIQVHWITVGSFETDLSMEASRQTNSICIQVFNRTVYSPFHNKLFMGTEKRHVIKTDLKIKACRADRHTAISSVQETSKKNSFNLQLIFFIFTSVGWPVLWVLGISKQAIHVNLHAPFYRSERRTCKMAHCGGLFTCDVESCNRFHNFYNILREGKNSPNSIKKL